MSELHAYIKNGFSASEKPVVYVWIHNNFQLQARFDFLTLNLKYPVHSQLIFYMLIYVCILQNASSKNEVFANRPQKLKEVVIHNPFVENGPTSWICQGKTGRSCKERDLFQEGSAL